MKVHYIANRLRKTADLPKKNKPPQRERRFQKRLKICRTSALYVDENMKFMVQTRKKSFKKHDNSRALASRRDNERIVREVSLLLH